MRGFGIIASLFPGPALDNATGTSPGNLVEFNQSDDFETPKVCFQLPYSDVHPAVHGCVTSENRITQG